MNWDAIGAVAVLITLVFLTLQLRYANVLARSSASSVQSTRMMDRFLRVAESDGFAALLTKEWDSDGLSDIEKTQITYYVVKRGTFYFMDISIFNSDLSIKIKSVLYNFSNVKHSFFMLFNIASFRSFS